MPNFHMHWLVALQVADMMSSDGVETDDISKGKGYYLGHCAEWKKALFKAIEGATKVADFRTDFVRATQELETSLRTQSDYGPITCFSAYMLGACGPDFWTLMSKEGGLPSGDHTAGIHFDFGHYNRTHQQFRVSGDRLRSRQAWSLTDRVERAYFTGMAVHVATDLVMHELVNVYAGAYNILKHCWENEHGATTWVKNLWSTHNKVEHFWDTYVRYRWLGDWGTVWSPDEANSTVQTLGLPLADTLLRDAAKLNPKIGEDIAKLFSNDKSQAHGVELAGPAFHVTDEIRSAASGDVKKRIKANDETDFKTNLRYLLERPIIFPRIFCDRMLARDGISPFIYDVVVRKGAEAAYPPGDVFAQATAEATTEQMSDLFNGGRNESNKLKTFCSRINLGDDYNSFNFQIYFMCPRLARLREYGPTMFWEPAALPPFMKTAVDVSSRFAWAFTDYAKSKASSIGVLEGFWNLDTGLGLQIQNVATKCKKEVRTRIKFPHVTEATHLKIEHTRQNAYTGGKGAPQKYNLAAIYGLDPAKPAFNAVDGGPYPTSYDVAEASKDAYLKTIITEQETGAPLLEMSLDEFFAMPPKAPQCGAIAAGTDSVEPDTVVKIPRGLNSRLTLDIEVPIVRLGDSEITGFALYSDKAGSGASPQAFGEKAAEHWLGSGSQALRFIEHNSSSQSDVKLDNGRAHFTGRILLNLDDCFANVGREIEKDKWNNVVDAKEIGKYCGKNFAVAACRQNVLKQNGDGNFWANRDFQLYTDLTPTEQIFLTLYALVRTPNGCIDACTGKPVSKSDFENARKIQCVGFVPIVLLYVFDGNRPAQLSTCYVDALRVKPITVSD
jgi:hypothetical protein